MIEALLGMKVDIEMLKTAFGNALKVGPIEVVDSQKGYRLKLGEGPDGKPFLRFAFAAEPVRHYPDQPLDTGIVRALWLTPAALQADMARLRSPLVWQAVSDWLAGQRHPLSMLRQVP